MIKKYTALFLSLLLLLSCAPRVRAATAGTYMVLAEETRLVSTPELYGSVVAVLYKGSLLTVTDVSNGFGYTYRASLACYGWVDLADCEKVNGEEFNASNIIGISLTLPDKLFYIHGEERFDDTGLVVWAVFANGTRKEVGGYTLYQPSLTSLGEHKIYVSYKPDGVGTPFQASFSVSVIEVPLERILLGGTAKTAYVEGQTLSLEGLTAAVSYLDGRDDRVFSYADMLRSSAFRFSDCCGELSGTPLTVGRHSIRVTYQYDGFYADFTVEARAKQPVALAVETPPYFPFIYEDARTPDLTGLRLLVTYDNGDTALVYGTDCTVIFDEEAAVLGENLIEIEYMGVTAPLYLEMLVPTLRRIEVQKTGKTVYGVGESFDGSGVVVYGWFDSGNSRVLNGWTVDDFDTSTPGVKTVTISHGGCRTSYTIYVTVSGYLPGDADLDGRLTAADARLILRRSVGLETLTGAALLAADRNGNGAIEAEDARLTLRAAVGLEPVLPDNGVNG